MSIAQWLGSPVVGKPSGWEAQWCKANSEDPQIEALNLLLCTLHYPREAHRCKNKNFENSATNLTPHLEDNSNDVG
ncbi:hypothetical protein N7450_003656 [Penicillium hetheringtonii]|uniref:Uncharacterized protein n=1 Tax=Penicillium hetheringtonii TaxID=911720 RepID=A0AAD6DNI3_9EURO|nr:hypothetical protein N7450_003656 [Penicillium hetheringtonii]